MNVKPSKLTLVPNPLATSSSAVALVDGVRPNGQRFGGFDLVDTVEAPAECRLALLAKARLDLDLSLGDAARALGLSVPDYCKVVRGVLLVVSHTEEELVGLLKMARPEGEA